MRPSWPGRVVPWLWREGDQLRDRVIRGAAWQAGGSAACMALGMAKIIVLARLLGPADFGLYGMAAVVYSWASHFSYTGMNPALIHERGDIRPYLSTVWTVQILRSVGIAVVLFFVAPVAGWFFDAPGVTPVLRAMGAVMIATGLTNPAIVYLRKELDFRRLATWNLWTAVVGFVAAVPLAVLLANVWAIVLSMIVAQVFAMLLSYWIVPFRPSLSVDINRALELLRYGKWVFWSHLAAFVTSKLDTIVVGKMLGATMLGYYRMALQVAFLPASEASMQLRGVMFPAFVKLEGTSNLRRGLLRTLGLASVVAFPLACFLVMFGELLVTVVLGPRWVGISACLPFFAVAGIAVMVTAVTSSLLMAASRPDLAMYPGLVRLVLLAALLYPLTSRGDIRGAALAVAIAALAAAMLGIVLVSRALRQPTRQLLEALQPGVLASIPFLTAGAIASPAPTPMLAPMVLAATTIYLAIAFRALRAQLPAGSSAPPRSDVGV